MPNKDPESPAKIGAANERVYGVGHKLVGKDYQTADLYAKVTGQAKYAEDYHADGMLYCKLLLSPLPHARVKHLDVREALAGAGVAQPAEEPRLDVHAVPADLAGVVTDLSWRTLSPLDRYALWKVARGKHPEEVLPRACAEIVPLSTHVSSRVAPRSRSSERSSRGCRVSTSTARAWCRR